MAQTIISVIAQKGGAGKTTLAVNLAFQLKKNTPRLKVIIVDADPQRSASVWLERSEKYTGIRLLTYDRRLELLLNPYSFDVAIVDCPPGINDVTTEALLNSDLILLPVGQSLLEINALTGVLEAAKRVTTANPSKKYLIVPTMVTVQSTSGKEFRNTLKAYGNVSKAQIGQRVAFSDSPFDGTGVCHSHTGSPAHKEIVELTREIESILKRG